jgi:predicted TIM-barrel fold metal-dependent hydrolase
VIDPTVEFTDPYLGVLRPVPPSGRGVCRTCHSGPSPGFAVCASCDRVRRQVSRSTQHVLPISLSVVGRQLHELLRRYKNAPRRRS